MIELYYWTTPDGHKITIFLEATQLPSLINRIRAIIDRKPIQSIRKRPPATVGAYVKAPAINTQPTVTEEAKKVLLGPTAR
jgi:hypothetical protein